MMCRPMTLDSPRMMWKGIASSMMSPSPTAASGVSQGMTRVAAGNTRAQRRGKLGEPDEPDEGGRDPRDQGDVLTASSSGLMP